jgi:glycosyltransferase involved in cell wall biosynthesis
VTPVLTVGLPVYNGARTLACALDSLQAQTLSDLEILISDNGSTDNTPALASSYAARDARIRYLREETNRGPTFNFNRLLDLATTAPYFMWAAHDDRWAPDYASSCIAFLESHPRVGLCAARSAFTDPNGRETGEVDLGCSLLRLPAAERAARYLRSIDRSSIFYGVYRRELLGGRRLENRLGNDHVFVLELALEHEIHTLPSVKLWKQRGGTSASFTRAARVLGVGTPYWGPLKRLAVLDSLFDSIGRSPVLSAAQRARLKREAILEAGRRYLRRLRSPRYVATKVLQDLRDR